MKRIYKYPIVIEDYQELKLPIGAEILKVYVQNENVFIWAIVDTSNNEEVRAFELFGTGDKMQDHFGVSRKYIGTFQLHKSMLVFHLFERTAI